MKFDDMKPRYVPSKVICRGVFDLPVLRYVAYPVGTHPQGCPVEATCVALELVTERGSRWFGVAEARINSELRMVIQGTNPRDVVRMRWEVCEEL